jgi:hypothetical protein
MRSVWFWLAAVVACGDPTECELPRPAMREVVGPCSIEVARLGASAACRVDVRWQYMYDGDRLVRIEKHNTVGVSLQLAIELAYDERDRLAAREARSAGEFPDPVLWRESYQYDELDRVIAIETEDRYGGDLELRTYDLRGSLVGHTLDRLRDGTLDEVHRYVRDATGELVARECDGCGQLGGADGVLDLVCKRERAGDTVIESCDGGRWPLDG